LSTLALGRGLSAGTAQTGMFGVVTFGGAGTTCSGPFRVRPMLIIWKQAWNASQVSDTVSNF